MGIYTEQDKYKELKDKQIQEINAKIAEVKRSIYEIKDTKAYNVILEHIKRQLELSENELFITNPEAWYEIARQQAHVGVYKDLYRFFTDIT